jgi:hypothetical protein
MQDHNIKSSNYSLNNVGTKGNYRSGTDNGTNSRNL